MIKNDLKYTKDHEWIKVEGTRARIGISDHAQEALGDVVFVELPAVGDTITLHDSFGTVESVKAVSDIYAPVSGEVVEINEALLDSPELVNSDPYGEGWMIVVELEDEAQLESLLSASEYEAFLKEAE